MGSLFDGIGGFPLAGERAGLVPVWASEVESAAMAVTTKHFPGMKHLGDITQINGSEIEPVDVITAGSPCQDLSVAGKREGLKGDRSGLFMDFMRIVKEMRYATSNEYPRFIVWENVPGAYSSNGGQDFRAVIEEIAEAEVPMPSSGKWATSGMVRMADREIAWRTLDAQYWGVPQRRKRIFLVADFGGHSAGEILFKPEGLSGDTSKSREKGKGAAENVDGSVGTAIPINDKATRYAGKTGRGLGNGLGIGKDGGPSPSLTQGVRHAVCVLNDQGGSSINTGVDVSPTLRAEAHGNLPCILDMTHANDVIRECGSLVPTLQRRIVMAHGQANAEILIGKVPTLNCNHEQPIVMSFEPVRIGGTLRRLMPIECERLQGFPDGWTEGHSDTQRYKMTGNSVAVPCVVFVLTRIGEVFVEKKVT